MALTIAISGINAVDSPGPGVAVARSIAHHYGEAAHLVGLAYDATDPGLFDSSLFDAGYLLPYPANGPESLLRRLVEIHEKRPLDIIVPTLDSEMMNFAHIEAQLREMGIRMFIPTAAQIEGRSKTRLIQLAEQHGFAVPKTVVANDAHALAEAAEAVGYPLFVKGIYYDAYRCENIQQVRGYGALIAQKWGYPLLLQAALEGEEFNAAAIGDGKGKTVSALCMKKLLFTDKGKGWAGVSIRHQPLLELTDQFISAVQWKGPLEMETLLSGKDGRLYIIEINPRFPAWIYLSVATGNNMPARYVQLANGETVAPDGEYHTGKIFTHYTIDLIGEISQLESLLTKMEINHAGNRHEKDL